MNVADRVCSFVKSIHQYSQLPLLRITSVVSLRSVRKRKVFQLICSVVNWGRSSLSSSAPTTTLKLHIHTIAEGIRVKVQGVQKRQAYSIIPSPSIHPQTLHSHWLRTSNCRTPSLQYSGSLFINPFTQSALVNSLMLLSWNVLLPNVMLFNLGKAIHHLIPSTSTFNHR